VKEMVPTAQARLGAHMKARREMLLWSIYLMRWRNLFQ